MHRLRLRFGFHLVSVAFAACSACGMVALAGRAANAQPTFTLTNTTTAPNGVWSWFEDERAIIDDTDPNNTLLIVSSVSAGAAPENGDVDVLWRNLDTGAQGEFELSNQFEQDDHDSAALYIRPDGRYLAMYSRHGSDSFTRWRVSTSPHDPTDWGAEQTLDNGAGTTYNNTYFLPDDNGGLGRTYNFTRADGFDPIVQTSTDHGSSWVEAGRLLTEGGSGDRPYVRYASDGKKIHFITTERHPRNFLNSIYHGYVVDGVVHRSDGTVADSNLFNGTGIAPATLTPVFKNGSQFGGTTMNRAWTINLEMDNTGNPVGIFTARANDSNQDHRFFYARYDGATWQVNEMAQAGGYLYAAEDDYTGLASIDPSNPNVVYMSSDIDPVTENGTAHYELYKGITSDFGKTWTWTSITQNSTGDNLRPVVPRWNGRNTALTWLQGTYTTYTNWSTDVVGISFASTGPKSLLWRGDASSPNQWDINNTANWDSGGDLIDVYQNGDEVAFDDTASSYTVNLPTTVTPMGVAFNNSTASYIVTGAGIGGGGRLRVIGGGTVTLANAANTYTGETMIARGTLALAGGATIAGTPHIRVMNSATFDVTSVSGGAYTLANQTLSIDGDVNGNIVATNNSVVHVNSNNSMNGNLTANSSTVTGSGTVNGNLTAQTGSVVQVGGAGMLANKMFTYLDATHGVGGNTTLSNGSTFQPTTNPNWQIRGLGNPGDGPLANNGQVYQGGSNDPNSAPELRTKITGLSPGESYTVYANYWDADGSTWRILAGNTSGSLTLFDSPLDNVAGATNGIDPDSLNYTTAPLTAEGNRLMWGAALGERVANASGEIEVFINDTGTNDGDDRTWYDGLSYSGGFSYSGQATMTIDGDFTLGLGASLKIDIGNPLNHDQLIVTGAATLAGTLEVSLAEDGLPPQLGDVFDILDFASVSGSFGTFNLPNLATGLRWDVSSLYSDGLLSVVSPILVGDYNGDDKVDAADYVIWRKNPGALGGSTGYNTWRANFGRVLQPGGGSSFGEIASLVPEPTSATLVIFGLAAMVLGFRRRVR